jgi:hypothetical protein
MVGALLFATSFGKGLFDGCIYAAMHDVVPDSARATAAGMMTMLGFLGAGVSTVALPAIAAIFGASLDHFAPEGAEYAMIAHYLGQLCAQIVLMLSPERIVLGGGVSGAPGLVRAVHRVMVGQLGRYAPAAVSDQDYLTAPALGQDAGIRGALVCASAADRELA